MHKPKETPVVWKTSIEKINDSIYDVTFTGAILENWYVFSQYNPEEASITHGNFNPRGRNGIQTTRQSKRKRYQEKVFSHIGESTKLFSPKKPLSPKESRLTNREELTQVKLHLFGQVCETACIQFEDTYAFSLNGSAVQKQVIEVDSKSKKLTEKLTLNSKKNTALLKDSNPTDERQQFVEYLFSRIRWWLIGIANALCVSNDSPNRFLFHKTISIQR